MNEPIDPEALLDGIREAAFDLRARDPNEAVKALRKLLKQAGPFEPLVHGALGEILLEEFDDVDGAIHHYRKLVHLAPDLPAGHLGLARATARNGEVHDAHDAFARAQKGLGKLLADARAPDAPEHIADTAAEALLSALEAAIEEHELAREYASDRTPSRIDADLLAWAEAARVFDDEEGDLDDWLRYARLRAVRDTLEHGPELALAHLARLAAHVPLPADRVELARSFALDAAGRTADAADAAARAVGDLSGAFEAEEVLRAADLLEQAGRKADADALLGKLYARLEHEMADADDETRAALEELIAEVRELAAKGGPKLVGLGRKR